MVMFHGHSEHSILDMTLNNYKMAIALGVKSISRTALRFISITPSALGLHPGAGFYIFVIVWYWGMNNLGYLSTYNHRHTDHHIAPYIGIIIFKWSL